MLELVRRLLSSETGDGWSQMKRLQLVEFAEARDFDNSELFADFCLCLGIGDGTPDGTIECHVKYRESSEWSR